MHFLGDHLLDPEAGIPDPVMGYAWLAMATRDRHTQPPGMAERQRAQARARAADVWETLSPDEKARATAILARCDAGPPYRLPDEVERD
jgi:hypothetical protein